MKVTVSFETAENGFFEADYELKAPDMGHINRMVKQAQNNPMAAQRSLVMSLVAEEDASRLEADVERYPGIALSIANRLLEAVGMTAEVSAKN